MIEQHGFGNRSGRWHRRRCRRRSSRTGRRRHGLDTRLGRRLLGFPRAPGGRSSGVRHRRSAPRPQGDAGDEVHQRQQRQQAVGRGAEFRQQQEFGRRRAEHDQRQQMVHQIFRARARTLDDFEQQQHDAAREQDVAQRHRPFGARQQCQVHPNGSGEGNVAHQEDDDVVDRERNEQQRKTDHGGQRLIFRKRSIPGDALKRCAASRLAGLVGRIQAARIKSIRIGSVARATEPGRKCPDQDSFFFRTCRPLYMPVLRSR